MKLNSDMRQGYGLKSLRVPGAKKHCIPPTLNSRTQKRKAALQTYNQNQRRYGKDAK